MNLRQAESNPVSSAPPHGDVPELLPPAISLACFCQSPPQPSAARHPKWK